MLKAMFWKITLVTLLLLNLGLASQASAFCVVEGKSRVDDCPALQAENQPEGSPEATGDPTTAARIVDPGLGFGPGSDLSTEYYPSNCYTVTRCSPRGCKKVRVCD